ncbi:hypothetical protein [uncultured Methanoregula sp.]|uniref:hypothetical protein n=1 Tax=uncultured Methanoregula sp. TaxID=1005933 RepID=UPI002AABB151|nr:hypothetical protein [uncultured Methanoregula sp.]
MQNVSVTPTGYAIVSTLGPDTAITPGVTPTSKIEDSARFGSDYERVYSISKKFSFGQKELFSQNVTTPPLYIKFDLTPVKINRHILVGIGTHQEHMENVTENSPNAWFEVKVFNIIDESLAYDEGFGNDFSDMTNQEFMVRQPGKYRIEMSGHEVFANVTILTGIQ